MLQRRWYTLLRWTLGLAFIWYGLIKVVGGQFNYAFFDSPWTLDSQSFDSVTFVWMFFGYSRLYGLFIGLGELTAGLLLLFRRTSTIGALAYLPIALNISVLDITYGFPLPATMLICGLTLGCLGLLWMDRRKLLLLFEPAPEHV